MPEFFAAGRPRTKGNVHAFVNKATGKLAKVERSKKTGAWMGVVAHAAAEAGVQLAPAGGVEVTLHFLFARPASHFGTGKNADQLKDSAPPKPTSRSCGDIDKLERAVLDALTGIAFVDDSEVTAVTKRKSYLPSRRDREGVLVRVEEDRS